MATSESKDDAPIFKCPICLEKLKRPRILPCLHSFCELCLQSLLRSSSVEKEHKLKAFDCPVCRAEVISPTPNITVEEWSSKMPLNHFILSLDDHEVENVGVNCDPCSRAEEVIPAKYRCKECKENICEMCYTYHKRLKGSISHTVSDIMEQSASENIEFDEYCLLHENRECDVFCFEHESLCCSICSATNHKQCQTVKALDEIVRENDDCVNLNDFISLIGKMSTETIIVKETTRESIKTLEKKQTNITDKISNHIDEVKDKLDQLRDQFQKEVIQTHFDEKQALELIDGSLSGFLITLEDCKKIASVVAARGSKQQQFSTMQKIRMRISSHLKKVEKMTEGRGESDYVFEKDETFYDSTETILKSNAIGYVTTRFSDEDIASDIQKKFYANLFECSSNDFSEATYRYTYKGASKFAMSVLQNSSIFKVQSIPWAIRCGRYYVEKRRADYLGVYLQCLLDCGNLKWSLVPDVEIRIINHLVKKANYVRKLEHKYTRYRESRGYLEFMKWDELMDSANGFVRDDKFTLEVQIKADVPSELS